MSAQKVLRVQASFGVKFQGSLAQSQGKIPILQNPAPVRAWLPHVSVRAQGRTCPGCSSPGTGMGDRRPRRPADVPQEHGEGGAVRGKAALLH